MSKVKLFEEFEVLNESNELIKAQEICKSAMFQSQKMLDKLFKELANKDMIEGFTTKVSPYNNGYELKLKLDFDWKKLDEFPKEISEYLHRLTSNTYINLQPNTFFESYLEEGKGMASIEGRILELPSEKKAKYEETYPKWSINQRADIPKVQKEFVEKITNQVKSIEKSLGL